MTIYRYASGRRFWPISPGFSTTRPKSIRCCWISHEVCKIPGTPQRSVPTAAILGLWPAAAKLENGGRVLCDFGGAENHWQYKDIIYIYNMYICACIYICGVYPHPYFQPQNVIIACCAVLIVGANYWHWQVSATFTSEFIPKERNPRPEKNERGSLWSVNDASLTGA